MVISLIMGSTYRHKPTTHTRPAGSFGVVVALVDHVVCLAFAVAADEDESQNEQGDQDDTPNDTADNNPLQIVITATRTGASIGAGTARAIVICQASIAETLFSVVDLRHRARLESGWTLNEGTLRNADAGQ